MTKDGGPAFPVASSQTIERDRGMSLRDWFAGMALQGMSSSGGWPDDEDMPRIVSKSYKLADVMLSEREKAVPAE